MTQIEAISLCKIGNIITHPFFDPNEFIYSLKGQLFTEEGYPIKREFWDIRSSGAWQDNWEFYNGFQIGKEYKDDDAPPKKWLLQKIEIVEMDQIYPIYIFEQQGEIIRHTNPKLIFITT